MLDDLVAALEAYRAAQSAVVDAERAVVDRRAEVPVARQRVAAAIVRAAADGVRQRDLVDLTGYSREQIRRITRAGGVTPTEE